MSQKLCACGCGMPVKWAKAKFLRGHNNIAKYGKKYGPKEWALCACGCGQRVKTAGSTYCRGHSNTPETRQANSERMKANNPMRQPDVSAKQLKTWRANGQDKISSQKMKERHEAGELSAPVNTPELRKINSERMKANNPMRNSEVAARVLKKNQTNGSYKQAAERLREKWQDPEYQAAQVERMKTRNPMFQPEIIEKALHQRSLQGEPSKMELWFSDLCEQNEFQIWYSGMGDFWVNGRNPDFKVHNRKMVIEITDGYTYRQSERTVDSYALPTIEHYRANGFGCLVVMMPARRSLWKDDLRESLTQAILDFIATGKSSVWTFKK